MKNFNSQKKQIAVAALAVLGANALSAQAMEIVRDHKPLATIVVAKDASPQVQSAAQLLQKMVAQSSGATLPISETASGVALHVGSTPGTAAAKLDLKKLDEDGYVLRALDKKNFAIIGGSDWGTEFGVDEFLERYLGVRWLMPTELFEDVPQHATIDLPDDANVRQEPVYLSRSLSPLGILGDSAPSIWARRNRARGRIGFHHNLLNLFPPSKYFVTHPEFYPIYNGKPYVPIDDKDPRWQPNFSAPGIVDAAVEEINKFFDEHPEATSYSLGMNDSAMFDERPESKARRNGKKNFLGLEDVSDDYFQWANEVVERVLQKHPGKVFGTLAYNNIALPPTRVKVHPAIVPFITYERMRWADPELEKIGKDLTLRWAQVSPNIGWYDYAYGISYQLPRVWFHEQQDYLSWGAKNHVNYHYAELYPNFGTGPKSWIFTKLLWNPNQSVDALLDDWYVRVAGKQAAPKLRAYYEIWEKFWTQDIQKSKWNTQKGQYLPFYTATYLDDVPREYLTRSDKLLDEALALADTPQHKARVAKLREMWEFYRASTLAYQALSAPAMQTEAQALKYVDDAAATIGAAQKRHELLEAFKTDPLYEGAADYISRYDGTRGESWGQGVLWPLLPWAKKSEAVKARLRQLGATGSPDAKAGVALMLRVLDSPGQQLLKNSNFAEGTQDWSIWDKNAEEAAIYHKGTFTPGTEYSQDGHSLLVQGLGRGALMQTMPYQPGSYYIALNYQMPKEVTGASASLLIRLLDETGKEVQVKGAVLPNSNIALHSGAPDSVIVPFELPADAANAKTVRLLFLMNGFGPDGQIYVDDLGVYRLD
jgi:hypothetical protein